MFAKDVYVRRRAKLMRDVKEGIILLLGNGEAPCNYKDNTYKFRQDSTFLYFAGLNDPDFALVLDVASGEEILFGNDVDIDDIIWMGPQPSVREKAELTGISGSRSFGELEGYLKSKVESGCKVHFLPPYRHRTMIQLHQYLGVPFAEMKEAASAELIKAVVEQRIVKDELEIAEIEKACEIGYRMHMLAMQMPKPGMLEQEVAGAMDGIAYAYGAQNSFATILSQNGETLHNHTHHQRFTDGRLYVVDAGAENNMNYCSDHTRTMPSGGKFTQKQKEVYQIVEAANNFAASVARPGITYKEVHIATSRLMLEGLSALGLVKGDIEEALQAGVAGLFMPHGLGHNMGLDVHDMENFGENYVGYEEGVVRSKQLGLGSLRMARKLVPGHVITDEPGIYFIPALIEKWKREGTNSAFVNFELLQKEYYNFGGIRLEDDLLITPDGCRLLGAKRLPISVEDVEAAMAGE